MRKRTFVLVSFLVALAFSGLSMEEPPITRVIYAHTAYTLPAGAWEVWGRISLIPFSTQSISIAYGVKDWTQIGTDLTRDILENPNVQPNFMIEKMAAAFFVIFVCTTLSIVQTRIRLAAGALLGIEEGRLVIKR